jgi:hypothetical protein
LFKAYFICIIRPTEGFVAKTYKKMGNATTKDKVFLNVVQSDKILKPSKTTTPKGDCWSVPYSLGPPHMEKDKKGENATCFDCCFHPEAIILGELNAEFKKLLVSTAMEGVDEFYKRTSQKVQIDRDFHVVKGISYKEGKIPTMLIATASKNAWDEKKEKKHEATTGITPMKSPTKPGEISSGIKHKNDPPASTSDDEKPPTSTAKPAAVSSDSNPSTTASSPAKPSTKAAPAIKKGFLMNAKNKPGLYDEKIQTIRPRNQPESLPPVSPSSAIHEEKDSKKSQEEELIKKLNDSLSFDGSSSSKPTEAAKPITDNELKAVATKRREKPVESSSSVPVPAPVKPMVSEKPKIVEEVKQPSVVVEKKKKKDEEKEKAAVGGPVEPVVVCKHREEIALGDFQGMQHEIVKSGRPNELVYEIQLPLVTTPSKIVLDVAEQQISLTYLDIYKLDMKLPYKVNDKKGKAAYDKNKKALKVTLPVIADFITVSSASTFQPPAPEPAKLVEEVKKGNDKEKEEENEEKSPEKPTAIPQTRAAKKAAEKEASHNRWVDSASSSETANDPAKEESKKLYEDIKRQAEIAQANALKEKKERENSKALPPVRSAATVTVSSNSSSSTTAVVPPAAPTLEELMKEEDNHHNDHQKGEPQEYIPSVKFIGARKGYFFASGVRGLGYYLDKPKQQPQPEKHKEEEKKSVPEKEKESEKVVENIPSHATTTSMRNYQLPPLEVKQTKAAISVLFQAPQILKDSVHVDCISNYLIDVSFQAPSSSSSTADGEVLSYGVRLHLDEKSCLDGIDKEKMEFDVASKNMALVLMKKSHQIFGSSGPDIIKLPVEKGEENKKTWVSFQELKSTADHNHTTTTNEQELKKEKTTKTTTGAKVSKDSNKSKSAASEAIQSTVNALRFNTDFINELD